MNAEEQFDTKGLIDKIRSRNARVAVIGLGYVGLPLAVEFARSGLTTVALDVDAEKIAQIEAGDSYIGVYRFDDLAARNGADLVTDDDCVVVGSLETTGGAVSCNNLEQSGP